MDSVTMETDGHVTSLKNMINHIWRRAWS